VAYERVKPTYIVLQFTCIILFHYKAVCPARDRVTWHGACRVFWDSGPARKTTAMASDTMGL